MIKTPPFINYLKSILVLLLALNVYAANSWAIAPKYELLYSFGQKLIVPDSPLVHDAAGNRYGVTLAGGFKGQGSIYKINQAGQYSVLYSFDSTYGKVAPKLMLGNNKLYGWTVNTLAVGAASNAVIYQLDLNQTPAALKIVYRNTGYPDLNDLILGRNGKLYGVTEEDGDFYTSIEFKATLFELDITQASPLFKTLHVFTTTKKHIDARNLIEGENGLIYGVVQFGGPAYDKYTHNVFTLDPLSTIAKYNVILTFLSTDDSQDAVNLTLGKNGALCAVVNNKTINSNGNKYEVQVYVYGINGHYSGFSSPAIRFPDHQKGWAIQGQDNQLYLSTDKAIYKLDTSGAQITQSLITDFKSAEVDSFLPGISQDDNGYMYVRSGNSYGASILQIDVSSATPKVNLLHLFTKKTAKPESGLIQTSTGKLYGATSVYGKNSKGSIFQLDISGDRLKLTDIYNFRYKGGYDVKSNLVQGKDGLLYGISSNGGANLNGTFFQFNPARAVAPYQVMYNFDFGEILGIKDRFLPISDFFQGQDGKFYGGFANINDISQKPFNGILQLDNSVNPPTFEIIHSYSAPSMRIDEQPVGLIQGRDGNLYGTTQWANFKLELADTPRYTVLNNFDATTGTNPAAGLLQAKNNKFYGTAQSGGANNSGTIYELDTSGSTPVVKVLHNFDAIHGGIPSTSLTEGSRGKFYGITYSGGSADKGVIYQLDITGSAPVYTVLHDLKANEGQTPVGRLLKASDGNLYGVTKTGGQFGAGTVYRIRLASPPPVNTAPVAKNDAFVLTMSKNSRVFTVAAPGVLKNDNDAEKNKLSVAGIAGNKPKVIELANKGGKVAIYADGHFVYTLPHQCFYGSRSFTYQATDGKAMSNPATVTLTIKKKQ